MKEAPYHTLFLSFETLSVRENDYVRLLYVHQKSDIWTLWYLLLLLFSPYFLSLWSLEICHLCSKPHNCYSKEQYVSVVEFIYQFLDSIVNISIHCLACCFFISNFFPNTKVTHASIRNIGNIRGRKKKIKMIPNLASQRKTLLKIWCIFF